MDSEQKLTMIREALEEKKAHDLTVVDLQGRTLIADYFVICSGQSNIQRRSIADGVMEAMKKVGVKGVRSEGYQQGTWILVDYGDVVVHIFDPEERERYQLEDLWERVPRGPEVPVTTGVYAGRMDRPRT